MSENKNEKKEREYDSYQKAAIRAKNNSVVSAGAGSGKTSVLSERFLALVNEDKINAEEILTLTFTKKATVEMSDRIYKVLKEKAPQQAANFYKANIKTLDAYCNTIAKAGAHFYGISPDYSMDDDTIQTQVNELALPFILEHRDNEAIKILVKTNSFDEISKQLFAEPILNNSTVATPIDFDDKIEKQVKEVCREWYKTSEELVHIFSSMASTFENAADANRKSKIYISYEQLFSQENLDSIPEIPVLEEQNIYDENYADAENYFKYFSRLEIKKPGNAKGFDGMSAAIDSFRTELEKLSAIYNYIYGFRYVKKILPLMKEFQNKVNKFKRSSGILNFNDVSDLALKILIEHPDIRLIEKKKFKAIMIDEFQDNNSKQRDLLFLLAEKTERMEKSVPEVKDLCKDKLFFVGDEKQSIYRFRGADVSVFRKLSKDFSEGNLSMTTNYRSHAALIAGFNTIFGGMNYPFCNYGTLDTATKPSVFYTEQQEEDETDIPDFEPVYHEVTLPEFRKKEIRSAEEKNEGKNFYVPHMHIATYNPEEENEDDDLFTEEAEAHWVAKKIIELTTENENGEAKYKPSDIAVLFRNYKLQHIYERTFLNMGIPYNTEVTTGFFADGPVNDIFAYLRLCVYNEDTLAHAQILRSPWINLTVDETNKILISDRENGCRPFEKSEYDFLAPESLSRYIHAKQFFEKMKESSKTDPITQTVTRLWYESGYRYETMWNQTAEMYGKMYDLIFELARKADIDNMSLAAFVDSVRTLYDLEAKLENMDIPLEQKNGVHIMTIHKSKGLEFPVVFVCATHKGSKRTGNDRVVYSSRDYGITINTPTSPLCSSDTKYLNYFFNKIKTRTDAENLAELKRVTYVALTRAKEELYITNGKYTKRLQGTMAGILEEVLKFYSATPETFAETEKDENGNAKTKISPFDYTKIESANRDFSSANNKIKNSRESKAELLKSIQDMKLYESTAIIEPEKLERIYANPSALHKSDDETLSTDDYLNISDKEKNFFAEYDEVDKIISDLAKRNKEKNIKHEIEFTAKNFGTIAHSYLECIINGTKYSYRNKEIAGLRNDDKGIKKIEAACERMADSFIETPTGKSALKSGWKKTEYDFRSRIRISENDYKIIKGTMDLVFMEDDGTYTIVDYKTNQKIEPELYVNQLACYRQALASMLTIDSSKIRCKLHYLRFNRTEDITSATENVDLAQAVKEL